MNLTLEQARDIYRQQGKPIPTDLLDEPERPKAKRSASQKPQPIATPVNAKLILWGHCPSKKNLWERGASGVMFIPADAKKQIDVLTTQALFQWQHIGAPVEHPDVTVKFFVHARRQDKDGMWTTVLDCLQKAGVIVNDNIAHFNGREVHEPCEIVDADDQRVEILITTKGPAGVEVKGTNNAL